MNFANSRPWWVNEVVVPVSLLGLAFVVAGATDPELMLLLLPLIAFASGWIFRPTRLWPIWLGAVLVVWVINGVVALFDLDPAAADDGETVWSFAFESLLLLAVIVLLPLWLGRLAARFTDHRLHQRTTGGMSSDFPSALRGWSGCRPGRGAAGSKAAQRVTPPALGSDPSRDSWGRTRAVSKQLRHVWARRLIDIIL